MTATEELTFESTSRFVEVDVDMDYGDTPAPRSFEVTLRIGADLSDDQLERLRVIAGKCPVHRLLAKEADVALAVLAETESSGIAMRTFAALTLEKARFILLAMHSPASAASLQERVSPDDWEFISAEAGKKLITPAILSALLEAADAVPRAAIETLPLELAVVRLAGQNK